MAGKNRRCSSMLTERESISSSATRISTAGWVHVHLKGHFIIHLGCNLSFPSQPLATTYVCAHHRHTRGCDHIHSNGFKYQLYAHDFQIAISSLDLLPELLSCRVNCSLYISPWMSQKHLESYIAKTKI